MRYEQYPENPELADREYAEKWLAGEWHYMTRDETEEFLLHYGSRKQRKAIKQRREGRRTRRAVSSGSGNQADSNDPGR